MTALPAVLCSSLSSADRPSLPLTSLSIPAPTLPLLSRGEGHSSSHLSLIALDPDSSVLRLDVLQRLQLSVIKGEARGVRGGRDRCVADTTSLPTSSPVLRKRTSSKLSSVDDTICEEEKTYKKRKKVRCCSSQLPLVPKQSLLKLDSHLSSAKCSIVSNELAAFALARHLVDWSEGFNIEPDFNDEKEEKQTDTDDKLATDWCASDAIGPLPCMPRTDSASTEWVSCSEWM